MAIFRASERNKRRGFHNLSVLAEKMRTLRPAECVNPRKDRAVADRYEIRVPAIEVRQGERRIYCFAVDGKQLLDFTAVSRVKRTKTVHSTVTSVLR